MSALRFLGMLKNEAKTDPPFMFSSISLMLFHLSKICMYIFDKEAKNAKNIKKVKPFCRNQKCSNNFAG